jgi:Na+/H+ antiporter NhaD/arsenite permease-like protein
MVPLGAEGWVRGDLLTGVALGAVFMGAMTYIGNGPNLMVRAIAAREGVRMPGFGGYAAWAAVILLPVFAIVTLLFLR